MNQQPRRALFALLAAASVSAAAPAYANVTTSGIVSPNNPSDPWNIGPETLVVGQASDSPWEGTWLPGEVDVTDHGTVVSNGVNFIDGLIQITGHGSRWTNHGEFGLGYGWGDSASLIVRDGAQVITDDLRFSLLFDSNLILVEGYGSSLTSLANTYLDTECGHPGAIQITQGGRFFSNNFIIPYCLYDNHSISVLATGYSTRWINTGKFEAHTGLISVGPRAKLSTVDATIRGSGYANPRLEVSGYDATWTNQGTLTLGASGCEIDIGAFATLISEDTFMAEADDNGGASLSLHGLQATWINSGVVSIYLTGGHQGASLDIDDGGAARFGGLVIHDDGGNYKDPVHLRKGSLTTGWFYAGDAGFDFAAGRLDVGSFIGKLNNTKEGKLAVGEVYPSTSIFGDYTQGPSARLVVTVAGPSATPLLQTYGDTLLDGRLEVRRANEAVTFHLGDSINVFDWAGLLEGWFSSVNIALPLPPGLVWDTSALYTTGVITVVSAN